MIDATSHQHAVKLFYSYAPSDENLRKELEDHLALRRANIIGQDDLIDKASAANIAKAKEIVWAVDGLPLALDQAGAYIEETSCSLARYLDLYQKQHEKLLKRRGNTAAEHDHPKPVANTWEISFKKVEEANPAAADLLRLCAFLAPDAIPEKIIIEGAEELGPTLQAIAEDPLELDAAIEELRKYSLVKRDRDAQTLTVHRLVQVVLRDEMDEEMQKQWAKRVVQTVNCVFPSGKYGTWAECERLLPHVRTCAELIKQEDMALAEAARLLNLAGYYLRQRAQYTKAELLYQQALTIAEKVFGPDHLNVATICNNLGLLYKKQGRYTQAEPLYRQALAIREKVLGPEHPDVAMGLNNLAVLYVNQGKYTEAEPLYQQALITCEKLLGPQHSDVATILNNLASLYHDQGMYAQAEPLFKRVQAIDEQLYGLEHPDVAIDLSNLASLYKGQMKYAQAEPLYQRALAIYEKIFEDGHPYMARVLENYADLLRKMKREDEAGKLEERVQEIQKRHTQENQGEGQADIF